MRLNYWSKAARCARADKLFRAALESLKSGELAIDCGANIGEFTLPMAQTGADVIAFEPDPEIFKRLEAALNGQPNAELYAAAVSTQAGSVRLIRSPYFAEDMIAESLKSTILPEARTRNHNGRWREMDHENYVDVPMVNLIELLENQIAKRGQIELLKIDIEGAELDILEAMLAKNLFANIGLTVVEMHEFRFPHTAPRIRKVQKAIRRLHPPKKVNFDWR